MPESKPKPKRPRISLSVRFQLPETSRYAPVVNFCNSDSPWAKDKQEKILYPMDGYWRPFALSDMGASDEEVRRAAIACIYQLQKQIALIADTFGLTDIGLLAQPDPTVLPPSHEAVTQTETLPSPPPTDEEDEEEIDYDYDGGDDSADQMLETQF